MSILHIVDMANAELCALCTFKTLVTKLRTSTSKMFAKYLKHFVSLSLDE